MSRMRVRYLHSDALAYACVCAAMRREYHADDENVSDAHIMPYCCHGFVPLV